MKQTKTADKALRDRCIAELGVDPDLLAPLLRIIDIVRPARGSRNPRGPPGLLPISARTFFSWVSRGLVEAPITFENGVSAWRRDSILRLALDGLAREPGHGRKLPAKNRPAKSEQPDAP